MDNKVVYTVARAFEQLGAPAIRFNFRGVGNSAGSYDEARGESADALAVIAYGRQRWPGRGTVAGGIFLWRRRGGAHRRRRPPRAPRGGRAGHHARAGHGCRATHVSVAHRAGRADEVVAPAVVQSWAQSLAPLAQLRSACRQPGISSTAGCPSCATRCSPSCRHPPTPEFPPGAPHKQKARRGGSSPGFFRCLRTSPKA